MTKFPWAQFIVSLDTLHMQTAFEAIPRTDIADLVAYDERHQVASQLAQLEKLCEDCGLHDLASKVLKVRVDLDLRGEAPLVR